jgi:hypothetical protein
LSFFGQSDDDEIFLFITASTETFLEEAEQMGLKKRLKSDSPGGGGVAEFTREKMELFETSIIEGTLFSSYERAQIVRNIIESKKKGKGFGIGTNSFFHFSIFLAQFFFFFFQSLITGFAMEK